MTRKARRRAVRRNRPPEGSPGRNTRRDLLEAGGEVFAEQGYHRATVREICRRAGANLAAVGYHFGGKEGLYAEVLQYAYSLAPYRRSRPGGPPEERLREYLRERLLRILDAGRPAWHAKLVAQEMLAPSPVLDRLVKQEVRPRWRELEGIVRELLGGRPSKQLVRRTAYSILGQCYFYRHAGKVIARLHPEAQPPSVDALLDHILGFSLAGIDGLRPEGGRA